MKTIKYRNRLGFPPTICIQVHNWCNLTCSFCRSDSSPFQKEKLPLQAIEKLLTDLSEFGKWRISITGGEPFFWKEIGDFLHLLHKLEFPFSITTNGNSTASVIKSLPKDYWEYGRLHVSIDGNKTIHDSLRGKGTFDNSISFLKEVREIVPRLCVTSVLFVNPSIWAKELFSNMTKIGIDHWTIISPVHSGRWDQKKKQWGSLLPYSEQYLYIKSIVGPSSPLTTLFLDFANAENKYADVVFVNSNGQIRLPGFFFFDPNSPDRPLVNYTSVFDTNAPLDIYKSVSYFLETQKYML